VPGCDGDDGEEPARELKLLGRRRLQTTSKVVSFRLCGDGHSHGSDGDGGGFFTRDSRVRQAE